MAYRLAFSGGSDPSSPLIAAPQTLSLGPVDPVSGFEHRLRITNVSDELIRIDEFITSCTCADISPSALAIEPGSDETVVLNLDLPRYVKPRAEQIIRGDVQVTPVVAGKRLDTWKIDLAIIRPKIMTTVRELDFGTMYEGDVVATSRGNVFVSSQIPEPDVRISSAAPFICRAELKRRPEDEESYREYEVEATVSTGARPRVKERFTLVVESPTARVAIPCVARFDSGIRFHVADPPPTILSSEDEVVWEVRAYSATEAVEFLDASLECEADAAECSVSAGYVQDDSWRLTCRVVPRRVGNISSTLSLSVTLASGERFSTVKKFAFYVPTSSEE
ncbi:MAG: hypothetical protein KY475_02925 [Planctomycetes bacterium]|nr:hypothetical protein [Planctomycetota bacterium]